MKQLFFTFLFFSLISSIHSTPIGTNGFDKYFHILPKPQKIEFLKRKSFSNDDLRFIHFEGLNKISALDYPLNSLQISNSRGKGVLTLVLSQEGTLPSSDEGYILEIHDDQIVISSKGSAGLFYGCQTLLQLLQDAHDQQIKIPSCKITDFPNLPFRAVHIDLKHHLNVGLYYYQIIDRLARIKINAIIFEFEDKLRYRKAPLVGASDAISVKEFAAISRYAKERHIEVSSLVQGLAHAEYILKHKEYNGLRDNPKSDWGFDPLNPNTYNLQFSLYEDAMDATPYGKYLHIGGDEVGNLGMSDQDKESGKTPFELQMYWVNKVCQFLGQHNRIPMFWDDMLFKLSGLWGSLNDPKMGKEQVEKIWKENEHRLSENIGLFPKNCIYMRWNYYHPKNPGNLKAIDWFKAHNLKVMAVTAATMDPDVMLPRDNSHFQSIKDFCEIASDKKMDGILCTVWDDRSPNFETEWRGLYFFALFSWNYNDMSQSDANSLFRLRFYGPLLSNNSFEFQNKLETALTFWETALIKKGKRSDYPKEIDLIDLPDSSKPGMWTREYNERISTAKMELMRYDTVKKIIEKSQQLAQRNRYSLALMNQTNELQIYPSKLLLLLAKYDEFSATTDKEAAMLQIQKCVKNFSEIRRKYEEVYSQNTFLNKPDDYILDQNLDGHLANGTKNSDWMYVYELAMNNKITNWLSF